MERDAKTRISETDAKDSDGTLQSRSCLRIFAIGQVIRYLLALL